MKQRSNRILSFFTALILTLLVIPGSVFAIEDGEIGHNHTEGYCYVCKMGDPEQALSYNVPQDYEEESPAVTIGEESYGSLAEAVNMANPGDALYVQRSMTLQSPILIDKDLTIVGVAEDLVITRGFSGEAMFTVCNGATVKTGYLTFDGSADYGYSGYSIFHVLDGSVLGISNGTVLRNNRAGYGGGVYVSESSRVQMNGETDFSQILQCSAVYSGGGIYSEGSVEILQGAYVTGNTADYGGGIWTLNNSVSLADPDAVYDNQTSYSEVSNILDESVSQLPEDGSVNPDGENPDDNVWDPVIHTVYLDPGDGSEPVPLSVSDGDVVPDPGELTWDGYVFSGWTYSPYNDGAFYPYDFSLPVYNDFTIYANWAPAGETQQETESEEDTDESEQNADESEQDADESEQDAETVYYQVSFDYGVEGWYEEPQTVAAGETAVNPYNEDSVYREGYTFGGWYYYTDEGPVLFDFSQPVEQDYYLTASWEEIQPDYVTVAYDPNDGVNAPSTVQIAAGTQAAEAAASMDGYTFEGWYYYDENGDYVLYNFALPVYNDLTLYAEWSEAPAEIPTDIWTDPAPAEISTDIWTDPALVETETEQPEALQGALPEDTEMVMITYEANAQDAEGSMDPGYVRQGEEITLPASGYTREGYDFIGWSTDPQGSDGLYYAGRSYLFEVSTPLYAQWNKQITVRLESNNEKNEVAFQTILANVPTALQANTYTNDGFVFQGWNTAYDGTGAFYQDQQEVLFTNETDSLVVLFAQWQSQEAELVYDANGGQGEMPAQTAPLGESVEIAESLFYKDGEVFRSFNTQQDGSGTDIYPGDTLTLTQEEEVIYAQYEAPEPVTVTLYNQGGSDEPASVDAIVGEIMPDLTTLPVREDYEFLGYFTGTDGTGDQYYGADGTGILAYPIDGPPSLFAGWNKVQPTTYVVTLDPNGGTGGTASVNAVYGVPMPALEALPELPGSVFGGYFMDLNDINTMYYDADGISVRAYDLQQETTLYAMWTVLPPVTYTVTFDMQGGSGGTASVAVAAGDPMPAITPPVRTDYAFGGYFTGPDGTGEQYYDAAGTGIASYAFSENITLYAKWISTLPVTYTVTLDAQGGGGGTTSVTVQSGAEMPQITPPVKTNCIFGGYYTQPLGAGEQYYREDGTSAKAYDPLAGTVLYAKWEEPFSVTFYTLYGTTPTGQIVMKDQKVIDPGIPAGPVPEGYVFEGWYTELECVNLYNFDTPVTNNFTLFAKWTEKPTPVQYFTVTFLTDKGTAPQPQQVQQGQRAYKPADPYAEGYLFGGWYLDQAYTALYNFDTPVAVDFTLYAKWAPRPDLNHVVSFNANGHGNAPNPQTVAGGSLAQKPQAPTAVGYTFTGWFMDPECTHAYNFQDPVTADITLYAGWIVNRYTVRFDSNSGVGTMSSIGVTYDQRVNLPANVFTKSGYYFLGWNTQPDGTGAFIPDQGEILNLTDVNGGTVGLFAQWKNIYNVIEGANAQVMKGSGKGLTFRCDGDYSKFTGIKVDGRNVSSSQYTSAPGSTVVTLNAEYVNQLPVGSHSLRFEYTDGGVETGFEVISRTPATGDTNNALIWIIVGIAALLLIGIVITVLLVRRHHKTDDDPYFDDFGPNVHNFRREYDNYDETDLYEDQDRYDNHREYDKGYSRRRDYGRRDDYEDYEGADSQYGPESEEDRYERYVEDQIKRRGKR